MENGTENGIYAETDIIETTDEDGQVHIFEKVRELEIDGQDYALLIYKGNEYPEGEVGAEGGSDNAKAEEGYDEEVVVMRISYEGDEEVFEAIEDEEEFERVVAFIETMEDEDDEITIDVSEFMDEESNN